MPVITSIDHLPTSTTRAHIAAGTYGQVTGVDRDRRPVIVTFTGTPLELPTDDMEIHRRQFG
jgi:hypothetical protein